MSLDVSIIICTRNRASGLQGVLSSLAAIRSRHAWEVLMIDNASTDDTAAVLAAADDCGGRLRVLSETRVGLGAARDGAWRRAEGRLIAFTDDDCYLAPDYIDALVDAFARRPHLGCIGGRIMLYDPQDLRVTIDERDSPTEIAPYQFVPAGAMHGANLSFRREVLERIGGVDPDLGAGTAFPCEDIDAIASAIWSGASVGFDPAPVVFHHHKRREPDLPALIESYDRGRGAYYAKRLLRQETRKAYLDGWIAVAREQDRLAGLERLRREIRSARAYLKKKQEWAALVLTTPVAWAFELGIPALITARKGKLKARRLAGRVVRQPSAG